MIGDWNHWSPRKREELALQDIRLLSSYKSAKRE